MQTVAGQLGDSPAERGHSLKTFLEELKTGLGPAEEHSSDKSKKDLFSGTINSPANLYVKAREEDVKLLNRALTQNKNRDGSDGSNAGLKFATHQLENAAVSALFKSYWAKKTGNVKTWAIIGKEALAASAATSDVLAQAAVTGTGIHLEPYAFRSYLGGEGKQASVYEGGTVSLGGSYGKGLYSSDNDVKQFQKIFSPGSLERFTVERPGKELDDKKLSASLIPFYFKIINPDNTKSRYLYFQANLDSYDDSYGGNWESTQYVGRGESFYNYTGFTRDISFSFKAVARQREDLLSLYHNLNYLAASTAPNYATSDSFMRGTLVEVTIGDLLKNQKGFFKSVKLSWKTDYPWSIGHDTENVPEQLIVPHLLDVSVSFTPIHSFNVASDLATNEHYFGTKST